MELFEIKDPQFKQLLETFIVFLKEKSYKDYVVDNYCNNNYQYSNNKTLRLKTIIKIKEIVEVLLDEKELEGEDRVKIFLQETGEINS
ncbi:MAG: hypothetical protein RR585_12840 [Coprobacillus sp.]